MTVPPLCRLPPERIWVPELVLINWPAPLSTPAKSLPLPARVSAADPSADIAAAGAAARQAL